jgi:putative ABC transport system ATP-binding protein
LGYKYPFADMRPSRPDSSSNKAGPDPEAVDCRCPPREAESAPRPVVAELIGASKVFKAAGGEIAALDKTDLQIRRGELLLIIGPSGSGKTTLLSLLGCVLYPTEGCVCIEGVNTRDLSDRQMAALRRRAIGFVFQNFNLIAPLTAEENIMAPLFLAKSRKADIRRKVDAALALVGLKDRRRSLPKQLSGGEQQRVAIARALVGDPPMILCDEPTASLDAKSIEVILRELRQLADRGKAVAVVTHDLRLAPIADQTVHLEHGRIVKRTERGA